LRKWLRLAEEERRTGVITVDWVATFRAAIDDPRLPAIREPRCREDGFPCDSTDRCESCPDETTTRQPAWESLKERDKKASYLAYRLRLTNVRALSADDHNTLCREAADMLHQLTADYADLRESSAVEPAEELSPTDIPCPHPGCKLPLWTRHHAHATGLGTSPVNGSRDETITTKGD
jgi:hypothetical protein